MIRSIGRGRLLVFLLLLLLWNWSAAPALAASLNANWQYRETGGSGLDTLRSFQQRYNLGVGPGVTFQPTHAISAGANLAYTRAEQNFGEGMQTIEEWTPSASLGVSNDIFQAMLSGYLTEFRPASGADSATRSWDATLSSAWQRRFWPSLSINYGERTETTRDLEAADAFDTQTTNYSFHADWDLLLAKLYYDYSVSTFEDLLEKNQSDGESHFVRVDTGGSLWQKRFRFDLSQQFQQSDSEFSLNTPGGVFERELPGVFQSLVSDPLTGLDPEDPDFTLQSNAQLGDGVLNVAAVTVADGQRVHLAVRFNSVEQVDRLDLHVDPFIGSLAAGLTWQLYTRRVDDTWELAVGNLPAIFNAAEGRVELTVDRQAREFMVIADAAGFVGRSLVIFELKAIALLSGDTSNRTTLHLSNLSMRLQLTRALTASANLTVEQIVRESRSEAVDVAGEPGDGEEAADANAGPAPVNKNTSLRRMASGNLRWRLSPYLSPAIGFSETRVDQTDLPDALTRTYSVSVASAPLPTLNLSLGASRVDSFSAGNKINTSDRYSLNAMAQIYPDLTANLNSTYAIGRREQVAAPVAVSKTWSNRFILNARLTPKLTADLTANYRQRESAISRGSSTDTTLNLLYRPSSILSMRLTDARVWSGADTPATQTFSLLLGLLNTHKTRLTLNYTHQQSDESSDNFGLDGSWDISRNLSLQARGNYSMSAGENFWSTEASLSLSL